MSNTVVNNVTLYYELYGEGPPVVLTPGGRAAGEVFRSLAVRLAASCQALIYDRRNCGASDVVIEGALSEIEVWRDDLHALIHRLGLGPVYLGGYSAGCLISVLLAQRYPQDVKGLLLLGPNTDDPVVMKAVADKWYRQAMELAQWGGMAAVIEESYFGQHLNLNPASRAYLLSLEVDRFCVVMEHWRTFLEANSHSPILGLTVAELQQLSLPILIVPGQGDVPHPQAAAEELHQLWPQSRLVSLPELFTEAELAEFKEKGEGSQVYTHKIGSILNNFIMQIEAS